MFKKILVPLDGSELAERALSPALELAQQVKGAVILLSVPYLKRMFVQERSGYGFLLPEESLEHTRRELSEYLEILRQSKASPDLTLRTEILRGDEASVIVDTAVNENVDLIVMSTHGRTGFSRWMLGSVTEKVLRKAACPVLVIRQAQPLARVLITLDGSRISELALEPGIELARHFDSSVTLLRTEEPEDLDPRFVGELDRVERGLGAQTREAFYHRGDRYLRQVAQAYQSRLGRPIDTVAQTGHVAESILDYIKAEEIDLVVMATHGRTGLQRWVYGSITEKVLRGAHCAMLVVRPPSHQLTEA